MESLESNYRGVFDTSVGFGRRPAVIVVDFVRAYVTEGAPLFAPPVVQAVRATLPVLLAARASRVPVIYTRVAYAKDGSDGGIFVKKVPLLLSLTEESELAQIVPELTPAPGEVVLTKKYPSAFFGTPLASILTAKGVDTVIVTGCSTSGCVRATVVDGLSYGYRVIVPKECVGDRHEMPHQANLFDIQSKYGDVVSSSDVLHYLSRLA